MVIDNIEDDSLLTEIFKLPKKNRIIIHLYYYENYDVKEIAKLLKMTESNVKVKVKRNGQEEYDYWKVNYHDLNFDSLHEVSHEE